MFHASAAHSNLASIEHFYDTNPHVYDAVMGARPETANHVLAAEFTKLVELGFRPERILDLFAGTGTSLGVVLQRTPVRRAVAVEIARGALDILRQRHHGFPGLEAKQGEAEEHLRTTNETYDLIIAMYGLHFMPRESQLETIVGMGAATEPGGYAIFTYDPLLPDSTEQCNPYTDHPQEDGSSIRTYCVPQQDITTALSAANLQPVMHEIFMPLGSTYCVGFVIAQAEQPYTDLQ